MSLFTPFYNFIQHWTLDWARLRAAEPPTGLLALPVELLTEILKDLPWTDVLHMRESCKLLSEATKTRAVWAYLVQTHISSKEIPPRLERPIQMYTSHELESLFLRWKSAEIGCERDDGCPAAELSFDCEPPEITHLIPGGRWFLVTSRIGAVTYYDLEAETISGVLLIPSYFPQPSPLGYTDIHVALEIDPTSPLLKFNLAISSKDRTWPTEQCHALYVWSVTVILDDSGHAVALSASRLAVLPHLKKLSFLIDLSLRGPYAAFTCYIGEQGKDYVVVVRWDQGNNFPYRMRIVNVSNNLTSTKIILLPETRVLLISDTRLRLWDYSDVEETTDFIPDNVDNDQAVVWTTDFRFHGYIGPPKAKGVASAFYTQDTVRILVSAFSLYAFSIDSLSDEPPTVHEVFKYPDGRMGRLHALGISHGIIYDDFHKRFTSMTYSVHPSSASFINKKMLSNPSQELVRLDFDEETGRVVLSGPKATVGYIIDYALKVAR